MIAMPRNTEKLYIGIDVGGTKIQVSLISEAGIVHGSGRRSTPRDPDPKATLAEIALGIEQLLESQQRTLSNISAIGIAVPGIVEVETGRVVATPNMNLSGVDLGSLMSQQYNLPVAVGNDCNLGTLGECWLGSGRNSSDCVGIFVGTGIGSGIVTNRRLTTGAGQAAGEIGHMVAQLPIHDWRERIEQKHPKPGQTKEPARHRHNGLDLQSPRWEPPKPVQCGCGNYGCFETLASRRAIERFIQEAVRAGIKSAIVELCDGNIDTIRSGAISKAIKMQDRVVTEIVHYASLVIGYTCLSVRHLLDPEVIILGGGVIEACNKFMMPIIEAIIASDKLPSAPGNRRVLISSLGDNAVVIGAVALARERSGESPLHQDKRMLPKYPKLAFAPSAGGKVRGKVLSIAGESQWGDFYLHSDGKICPRVRKPNKDPNNFRRKEIENTCRGGVELLIIGTDAAGEITLSGKCHDFLYRRGIDYRILPIQEAVKAYNTIQVRRAAIFHIPESGTG